MIRKPWKLPGSPVALEGDVRVGPREVAHRPFGEVEELQPQARERKAVGLLGHLDLDALAVEALRARATASDSGSGDS